MIKNIKLKDTPDSQEICFIPANDYISFLENSSGKEPVPGEPGKSQRTVFWDWSCDAGETARGLVVGSFML